MNNIAIIDSGISEDYYNSNPNLFIGYVAYKYVNDRIVKFQEISDKFGHGTSCVDCIHQFLPDARFYIVKILDDEGNTSVEMLTKALLDLIDIDVDIINLSLSLTNENCKNLEDACNKLSDRGKLIISSVENGKFKSYPATFDSVIGVIGDMMNFDKEYSYVKDSSIDLISDLTPMLVKIGDDKYDFFSGNSKAACIATVLSAEILDSFNNDIKIDKCKIKDYIIDILYKNTVNRKELPKMRGIPFVRENKVNYIANDDIGVDYLEQQFINLIDCTKDELHSKRLIELEGFFPNILCKILEEQSLYLNRKIKFNRFTYRNFEWFWCLTEYIEKNIE